MADDPTLSEREAKLAKAYKRKRELPDDPEDARLVAGLIAGGVLPVEKSAESEPQPDEDEQVAQLEADEPDTPADKSDAK